MRHAARGRFQRCASGNAQRADQYYKLDNGLRVVLSKDESVPAHTLETIPWAEANRMRGLDITQQNLDNQIAVVSNQVKVNILNQPYGGFPWLDVPQYANQNWCNYKGPMLWTAALVHDRQHTDAQILADFDAVIAMGRSSPKRPPTWAVT